MATEDAIDGECAWGGGDYGQSSWGGCTVYEILVEETVTIVEADLEISQELTVGLNPIVLTVQEELVLDYETTPRFIATAQSRVKIVVIFTEEMEDNADLINPVFYHLRDIDGIPVVIDAVEHVGPDNSRVQLILGEELNPLGYYVLRIDPDIVSAESGISVISDEYLLRWKEYVPPPIRIPMSLFSSGTVDNPLGGSLGHVFFSPAFHSPVANSTLLVDTISICTKAYDTYIAPAIMARRPLKTWVSGVTTKIAFGIDAGTTWSSAYYLGAGVVAVLTPPGTVYHLY